MWTDVRQGLRLAVKYPGFSLAAILTLALGIGANTAIFTVAWRVLLEPLPFPDQHRLVQVWTTDKATGGTNTVSPGSFHDWVGESRSFEALAAYSYFFSQGGNLTGEGEPEQLRLRNVTADYFRVFGMQPLAGRTLTQDDIDSAAPVIVLAEGLWRRRFAGDVSVVGRTVRLDDGAYTVVGVMPADFDHGTVPLDGWLPLGFSPQTREARLAFYLAVVGRLRPDVTLDQARGDVAAIAERAGARHPEIGQQLSTELSATVRPLREEIAGGLRPALLVLVGAALLVLLMACANLTSLQLARASGRSRELAVRAAVGATRGRLLRQLVTESLVVALVAGGVGLLLGLWALDVIGTFAPASLARAVAAGADRVVVACTLVLSLVSGCVFAVAPAWRAVQWATADKLRGRGTTTDRGAARARSVLVAAEVALALVLMVGAGLLIASLARVMRVNPGFDPANVLTMEVRLPASRYDSPERRTAFFDDVSERLRAVPGVTEVCAINEIPLAAEGSMTYVPEGTNQLVSAHPRTASAGCFDVLRIPLLQGRLFAEREQLPVAIVSEDFARRAWPGEDPVGRRIHQGTRGGELLDVIGVVGEARQTSLEGGISGQVYRASSQTDVFAPGKLLVRTHVPPASVAGAARQAIHAVDPAQPVAGVRTLDDILERSLSRRRFDLALLGSFAVVAFVLAAIGIYGLLSQVVSQRTQEIGVRMVLGARRGAVIRLILGTALRAVGAGVALGLAGAWAASRLLQSLVFEVSTSDPAVYVGMALALVAVAACAAWLPARRAARVDPMVALRSE